MRDGVISPELKAWSDEFWFPDEYSSDDVRDFAIVKHLRGQQLLIELLRPLWHVFGDVETDSEILS